MELQIRADLEKRIMETRDRLLADGRVLTTEGLADTLGTFRSRFGPEILKGLQGEELLNVVHDHSDRDSLVYWLEFKNDDEFPKLFGSISGGSALKFGLYRRKETGAWMTGTSQNQREVSTPEAIEIASKHRDQLVRGAELLQAMPLHAALEDYQELQRSMDEVAADVSRVAWGHKYFHLMAPDSIEDFHVTSFQQYYLIKLLIRRPLTCFVENQSLNRDLTPLLQTDFAHGVEVSVSFSWSDSSSSSTPF